MRRMWRALCLAACGLCANAQAPHFLTPTDFQTHFEPNPGASPRSGSRDGWESFPLSQEAGYDPSLQPETTAGVSILTRELAPTRDGPLQLGFIRRVHLVAGHHARITFRLRAPYLAHTTKAHLHIFRGESDEQHIFTLPSSNWQQLSLQLAPSAKPISAVAIAVDFPNAIHTRPERVLFTGLHLHALTARRIPIIAPAALWDSTRELFYLQRALTQGDDLSLQTTAATRWTLTAPDSTEAAHGFGASIRYRLPGNAPPGIWTIHLADFAAESTALVLVRPTHPLGLIFDSPPPIPPQLLSSIRERKAQLEKLTVPDAGRNISHMSQDWLLPGLPSYFAEILQPSELALMDAMLFRATGDPAALAQAQSLLTAMASWPTWVHPWFPAHGYHSYYPVGLMTKYIVMATQFLGPDLPAAHRTAIDRALFDKSVQPAYEEYVHEDRLQFNHSNWIGNTVGGALLAALASQEPDRAGYALGLFVKERDHIAAAYTPDGSYGEGVTYHRFDLETTELAAAAAKRLLGISLQAAFLYGDRYMRYAAYNSDALLDYGDSHVDLRPSNVFAYTAAFNVSANMSDFYFRYRDQGTAQILPRVLWESQIKPVASQSDSGLPSTLFPDRGIAILRQNWQPDSRVIAMRAGRNFNHNHRDEGSVLYAAHGILWLGEAGYADYYKDPNYNTFNTQAIGHNTLLVDGNPESQVLPGNDVFGLAPRFTDTSLIQDAKIMQADLTTVYPALTRYTRTLIQIQDGPTIVVDDVTSPTPHLFTAVWHPEQETSFDPATNAIVQSHGPDHLALRMFADAGLSSSLVPSPFPLSAYEVSEHGLIQAPQHLEVSTLKRAKHALLVTVLQPGLDEAATWKRDGNAYILSVGGHTFRIARSTQSTLKVTALEMRTDARVFHATAPK